MSDAQRDRIRRDVIEKLGRIQPKVDDRRFRLAIRPLDGLPENQPTRFLVSLEVPHIPATEPFYTGGGDCFVRLDGVLKQKKGPELTQHIHAMRPAPTTAAPIENPELAAMVKRVRQILDVHGLKHGHMARFLEMRQAPFTITLNDQSSDAMFLHWLTEEKIDWIARTFLIRREWIDGEDERIHEEFCFDKQPRRFWETVQQQFAAWIYDDTREAPEAFFIRRGKPGFWATDNEDLIHVVLRFPLAQLSDGLTIWRYITDFTGYPWDYPRTHIQLRAWARLLHHHSRFFVIGFAVSAQDFKKFETNTVFLPESIEATERGRLAWHPDDYANSAKESCSAKDTDTFPQVLKFLEHHKLP